MTLTLWLCFVLVVQGRHCHQLTRGTYSIANEAMSSPPILVGQHVVVGVCGRVTGSPMSIPAAVFSATLRSAVVSANSGAVFALTSGACWSDIPDSTLPEPSPSVYVAVACR